ncbi:PTS transporter subunit EIIC [Thermohalobacter berrensis]|uniref:PTS sugar transporter subunit IIC n=1 Tax=Thermohalobacter berrensis TaxID=99594 RepID=A0A419T461_9FIRM|nr:PTS transporter subunit EIIC [Thermohalobacter berrensis]RKD32251.1 PTS sugar transporter subunit IIC [Thermohalobacter berrensis]
MTTGTLSYTELAEKIIEKTGGKENILSIAYCMTRLRITVKDTTPVDKESLRKLSAVSGVVEQGNQLQVVLGPGRVAKVAEEIGKIIGIEIGEVDEAEIIRQEIKEKNATPFKLLLRRIANIFIPLIPAFIACGLVLGLNNIFIKINPNFANTTVGGILGVIGRAVFFGLNLFVGVNAAKEFKGSPMLGGTMAAVITMPALANVQMAGKPLVPGRGGIIAVLLVVAFSSYIERKVRKHIPEVLDLFLTPLITILVSSFAAIYILQPLGGIISDSIGSAVSVSIENGGAITGFILGGTFLPLVMTGLHQGLTPIHADLLKTTGENLLLPILAMAGAGQVGAALAVLAKTKSEKLKKTILSALPVGILGIGEPLIYGVTLPLGKPFIGACIGGAFGAAFNAVMQVASLSMGLSGLPLALLIKPGKTVFYLLGILVSYIAGFMATYMLGFDDPVKQ